MKKKSDIRAGRHCVFNMHVHLVFVTKYRGAVFTQEAFEILPCIFKKVCKDFGAEFIEFDGECDHVHLLVHYPPKVAIQTSLTASKAFHQGSFASNCQRSESGTGKEFFGLQVISLAHAVERQLRLSVNTLNNKKHLVELPFILRLKEEAFSATSVNEKTYTQ